MLKKAWEIMALVVIVVVFVNVAIAALKPWLPLIGLIIIGIGTALLVRRLFLRR